MNKAVVIGGNGFLGSHIVDILGADTAGRSEDNDIVLDVLDKDSLKELRHYKKVINCVGLSPLRSPKVPYEAVHIYGVRNIVSVLRDEQKFVHISAAGTHLDSDSTYFKTKWLGEQEAFKHEKTTVIRPGLMLGEGSEFDSSLNLARLTRVFPNIDTKVMPISVKRVARAVAKSECEGDIKVVGGEPRTVSSVVRDQVKGPVLLLPAFLWKPFFYMATKLGIFGLSEEQRILLREGAVDYLD